MGNQNLSADNQRDLWSETTLHYWMMVDGYPNLKEEVDGSIPDCEITSRKLCEKEPQSNPIAVLLTTMIYSH